MKWIGYILALTVALFAVQYAILGNFHACVYDAAAAFVCWRVAGGAR